ncbi:MAG: InlB B-repeat-containing protein, partial [Acholeplasmataceae bacterium]|nr:InlB B-repeat-containing protein [Acholeplasmataceae bacterium]
NPVTELEGHTFDGWYEDVELNIFYSNEVTSVPCRDITLYAKWAVNEYTITYAIVTEDVNPTTYIVLNPDEMIVQVSLGGAHSAALTSSGRLFTWGYNGEGQLGDNTTTNGSVPTEITDRFNLVSGDKIIQVSLGVNHSSALTSSGRLFMWGYNPYGQLGDSTTINKSVPTEITDNFSLVSGDKIIQLSLGGDHSSALTSSGRLFIWGRNNFAQLGDNTTTNRSVPTEITDRFNLVSGDHIIQVSLGEYHSSALTASGRLFMWGYNLYGQLGDNTTTNGFVPIEITSQFSLVSDDQIIEVSLGGVHSSALTSSGRLFMWGYNLYGQLGDTTTINRSVPTEITSQFSLVSDDQIIHISIGREHSSVLTSSGRLFMWGRNYYGQLGDNTTTDRFVPTEITNRFSLVYDDKIIQVSLGATHSTVLTSSGRLFMWGWNPYGQLGDSTTTNSSVPTRSNIYSPKLDRIVTYIYQDSINYIPILEGYSFDGWYSDFALTTLYTNTTMPAQNITLYAKWQINEYEINYYVYENHDPLAVITLHHGETIISISQGYDHISVLTSSGRIFTWGCNNFGQLGNGTSDNNAHPTPTEITNQFTLTQDETIVSTSFGFYHSSILTSTGRIFTWGYNYYGQLGDGTNMYKTSPTEITSQFNLEAGETIKSVSLGRYHSSLLTSNGRLFTWGVNWYGQLGDGTTNDRSTPLEITSQFSLLEDERIVSISLGDFHSSAITSLNRVFTWGYNNFGQLGNGTSDSNAHSTPIEITSNFNLEVDETIVNISSGFFHSSALTSTGRVFTWGRNSFGQLGDGTTTNRFTPFDITNQFNIEEGEAIISVSSEGEHSAILTSTGRMFTWGYNTYGQIGDGTTIHKTTPIEITNQFNLGAEETIAIVSIGGYYSAVLTSGGRMFTWGHNVSGQLGDGTTVDKITPTEIPLDYPNLIKTETYVFDTNTDSYVQEGYTIDGWYLDIYFTTPYLFTTMPAQNINLYGQLEATSYNITYELFDGENSINNPDTYTIETTTINLEEPTKEGYTFLGWFDNLVFEGDQVSSIELGSIGDLTLYAKWEISNYLLFFETNGGSWLEPIYDIYGTTIDNPVTELEGHTYDGWYEDVELTIFYGNEVTSIPSRDIILYAKWEVNSYEIQYYLVDKTIIDFKGHFHMMLLTSDYELFTWGTNQHYQLGNGTNQDVLTPQNITSNFNLAEEEYIIQVHAGYKHSIALTSLGRVFTWGTGEFGQLGNGTLTNMPLPQDITSFFAFNPGEQIVKLSTGFYSNIAITSEERIFTWGANWNGQLCNGNITHQSTPINVTNCIDLNEGETIISVNAGGFNHMVALTSQYRVLTWGVNTEGNLGIGIISNRSLVPIDITSNIPLEEGDFIESIASLGSNVMVLSNSGNVYTWGNNDHGNLGYVVQGNVPTPTLITHVFNLEEGEVINHISGCAFTFMAKTSMGRVFTWGLNNEGQIGNNTRTNVTTPADITSNFLLLDNEQIQHTYSFAYNNGALTSLGRIFMWGENTGGNLGIGTTVDSLIPQVSELIPFPVLNHTVSVNFGESIDYYIPENYMDLGWHLDLYLVTPNYYSLMPASDIQLFMKMYLIE